MSLINKLISGSPQRKTRIHDEKGNIVSLSRLLRNGPRAVWTGALRLMFNIRPELPWISYDAQREFRKKIPKNARILEFGSGMSTIFYANISSQVVSVEDSDLWYNSIYTKINKKDNVEYRFAIDRDSYTDGISGVFDLIMIDGSYRADCAEVATNHISKNGIIYLDNSDKGPGGLPGDIPKAEKILVNFAKSNGFDLIYFVDFAPTQLFVQQGLMLISRDLR